MPLEPDSRRLNVGWQFEIQEKAVFRRNLQQRLAWQCQVSSHGQPGTQSAANRGSDAGVTELGVDLFFTLQQFVDPGTKHLNTTFCALQLSCQLGDFSLLLVILFN